MSNSAKKTTAHVQPAPDRRGRPQAHAGLAAPWCLSRVFGACAEPTGSFSLRLGAVCSVPTQDPGQDARLCPSKAG